jgi:hypothetical protein|tara:strand:+ start:696 stop:1184 length:489 start_codon:yes stop_codon:yes gene_type:complete
MATVTSLLLPAHGNSSRGRAPYQIQKTIDLTAQAISCTGGDVVQCLTIPANTKIIAAGFQVVESATMNTGTNATAILGTGADDNEYVTAFDIDGASDGAYAPSVTPSADVVLASADTLDLTFAGDGATFSAGKIRVYAVLADVSDMGGDGFNANEVDRDTLA